MASIQAWAYRFGGDGSDMRRLPIKDWSITVESVTFHSSERVKPWTVIELTAGEVFWRGMVQTVEYPGFRIFATKEALDRAEAPS